MDIKKTTGIAVIIGVIILVAFLVFSGNDGANGKDGRNGRDGKLGAISSPDFPYKYIGVGGQRNYYYRDTSLASSTGAVCSFQGPAGDFKILNFTAYSLVGSTTATANWIIATSTSINGISSTERLMTFTTAGNGDPIRVSYVPTQATTSAGKTLPYVTGIVNGGEYVNFHIDGASDSSSGATLSSGTCTATFQEL